MASSTIKILWIQSNSKPSLFSYSTLIGTVHILQEVVVPLLPEGALWSCYQKIGCQGTASGSLRIPPQVVTGKNRLGISKYRKVQCRPVCSDVLFVCLFIFRSDQIMSLTRLCVLISEMKQCCAYV